MNIKDKKVSLSIKKLTENPWVGFKEKYKEGDFVTTKIVNTNKFNCFFKLEDDIEGVLHILDISWTRKFNHINELFKIGEELELKILAIEEEYCRVNLGLKQKTDDPWKNLESLLKIGDDISGKIEKILDFGIFVKLIHDIDGFIHISELNIKKDENIKDLFKIGSKLDVYIKSINKEERQITLTKRQFNRGDRTRSVISKENLGSMTEAFNKFKEKKDEEKP